MEGDFQLAILWGSSSGEFPWRIGDWVEEIRSLAAYLSPSFQHVCESNFAANALVRTSSSRTDLTFDV